MSRNRKRRALRDRTRLRAKTFVGQPFDYWRDRHDRRLAHALENEQELRDWCGANDVQLRITNEQHHWQLRWDRHYVQWWPVSAKCVVDERWRNGIHCHDVASLIVVLGELKERVWR